MTELYLDRDEAELAIESLRKGIPPVGHLRDFTVGRKSQLKQLAATIQDREDHEPAALLVQANYGAGKTHLLRLIREIALDEGFAVALVTVNSFAGVRFNRMEQVFGAVTREIEVPGEDSKGIGVLFDRYFGVDASTLPAGIRAQRKRLSMDGKWSRPREIKSMPLWLAMRGWHLSRSPSARDVVLSWLPSNWDFWTRHQYLHEHLVAQLPASIRSYHSERDLSQRRSFAFNSNGAENAWLALEDLQTLSVMSGLRGLVLLFDEFEDVIQNLGRIDYQRNAFFNLIMLMSHEQFTGWKYFAVTPEFSQKCRNRLQEREQFDFPVDEFDALERIKMSPVAEKDFLQLGHKVRHVHGIAYDWDASVGLSDRRLATLVSKLYGRSSTDQVRQATVGLVKQLDRALEA